MTQQLKGGGFAAIIVLLLTSPPPALAQNPVSPQLIDAWQRLDIFQQLMGLFALALVIMTVLVASAWRRDSHYSKQLDISRTNSDGLAVLTNAVQRIGEDNSRKITLLESSVNASTAARDGVTALGDQLTKSGVHRLSDLLMDNIKTQNTAADQHTQAVAQMTVALDTFSKGLDALGKSIGDGNQQVSQTLTGLREDVQKMTVALDKVTQQPPTQQIELTVKPSPDTVAPVVLPDTPAPTSPEPPPEP